MSGKQLQHRRPTPQRTCVVCHEKHDKRLLVRVVNTAHGIQIDPTGKLEGRGAYLCGSSSCWDRAIQGQALGNALRMALTDEDRNRLQQARP
ncbi:MAG: YlxR family protein [Anaerolineae bacterium]|nr:YlxR family protein [Anaerolineae bacterium]